MAVTSAQLATYIGADATDEAVQSALTVAVVLVEDVLIEAFRPVPTIVRDRLVLEVGHEVYKRKDSVSGSSQFADYSSGQPVAGPRDPLTRVWPVLRRYVLSF
jgi:hypothetical protein